jgi:hypothetical protein
MQLIPSSEIALRMKQTNEKARAVLVTVEFSGVAFCVRWADSSGCEKAEVFSKLEDANAYARKLRARSG